MFKVGDRVEVKTKTETFTGVVMPAPEEEKDLLEAVRFMDSNECRTVIAAARSASGCPTDEILRRIDEAAVEFGRAAVERFSGKK